MNKRVLTSEVDVLVVDDNAAMRRILRALLHQLGFKNIREAVDGSAALQELERKKADLVLSDWNMPVMNGIELVRAIRADHKLSSTPVLMLTAAPTKENIVEALQVGVSNYIVKPFNAKTLEEKLNKIFT